MKNIKYKVKNLIMTLACVSVFLVASDSVAYAAGSWFPTSPTITKQLGGALKSGDDIIDVFDKNVIPHKICKLEDDGHGGWKAVPDPDNPREISWINAIMGRIFAAPGVGIEMLLGSANISIQNVIYGKAAGDASIEGTGFSAGQLFQFTLDDGNPYGYVAAVVYATLRSIACLFLAILVMYQLARAGISVTGQDRSLMKEALSSGLIVLAMLFFMPNLVDTMVYIKDVVLVAVNNALPDGVDMDIVGAFWRQFLIESNFIHGILYTASVFFMLYLMFLYIGNALSCAVLFAFFPLIAYLSLSDKATFSTWLKQILGTILVPVIDGVLLIVPAFIMLQGTDSLVGVLIGFIACLFIVPARKAIKEALGFGGAGWGEGAGLRAFKLAGAAVGATAQHIGNAAKGIKEAAQSASEMNDKSRADEKENAENASLHEDLAKSDHGIKDVGMDKVTSGMKPRGGEEVADKPELDDFKGELKGHDVADMNSGEKGAGRDLGDGNEPLRDDGINKGGDLPEFARDSDAGPSDDKEREESLNDETLHDPNGDAPDLTTQPDYGEDLKVTPREDEESAVETSGAVDMPTVGYNAGSQANDDNERLEDGETITGASAGVGTLNMGSELSGDEGGSQGESATQTVDGMNDVARDHGSVSDADRLDASSDQDVRTGQVDGAETSSADGSAISVGGLSSGENAGRDIDDIRNAQELGTDTDRYANLQSIQRADDVIQEKEAKLADLDNESAFIKNRDDTLRHPIDEKLAQSINDIEQRLADPNGDIKTREEADKAIKQAERTHKQELERIAPQLGRYTNEKGEVRTLAGINQEKQAAQGEISRQRNIQSNARELEGKYAAMDRAKGGTGEQYKSAEEMAMRQAHNDVMRAHANHKNFDSKEMSGVLSSADKAKFYRERAATARRERVKTDALFAGRATKSMARELAAGVVELGAVGTTAMVDSDTAGAITGAARAVNDSAWTVAEAGVAVGTETAKEIRHSMNETVRESRQLGNAEKKLTNAREMAQRIETQRAEMTYAKNGVLDAGGVGGTSAAMAKTIAAHPLASAAVVADNISHAMQQSDRELVAGAGQKIDVEAKMQENIAKKEANLAATQKEIEKRHEARGTSYNPTLNVSAPAEGSASPTLSAREVRAYNPDKYKDVLSESRQRQEIDRDREREIDTETQLDLEKGKIDEVTSKKMEEMFNGISSRNKQDSGSFKEITPERVAEMNDEMYKYLEGKVSEYTSARREHGANGATAPKPWTNMSTDERNQAIADWLNMNDIGDDDDYYS